LKPEVAELTAVAPHAELVLGSVSKLASIQA